MTHPEMAKAMSSARDKSDHLNTSLSYIVLLFSAFGDRKAISGGFPALSLSVSTVHFV